MHARGRGWDIMEPTRALVIAIVAGAAAVGIVAADTVFGLHVRIDAQEGSDSWVTVWQDESRSRDREYSYAYPYGVENCASRTFRVVAENDKPLPAALDVRVTYWNNATQRTTTLTDERLSMAAFETRELEFTFPPEAGVGRGFVPEKGMPYPVYATVVFDGGYMNGGTETQLCIAMQEGA